MAGLLSGNITWKGLHLENIFVIEVENFQHVHLNKNLHFDLTPVILKGEGQWLQ